VQTAKLRSWGIWGVGLIWLAAIGCASTTGSGAHHGPSPIPEGMGRLKLEAGGINQLNFYVIDEETDEEVYSRSPRLSARSPVAYESGNERYGLMVDLPAGTYTVVVNTDVKEDIIMEEIQVVMGQEVYRRIPVGRFQVLFNDANLGSQIPFLIMDFNMRTILGQGMTSSEVRHFIVPEGDYKIRIENSNASLDEIKHLSVSFGRITPITFGQPAAVPSDEEVPGGQ
jgi:hypothetical protein